ncbi:GspE/PulE family protein [Patescibacteria group bacterium]
MLKEKQTIEIIKDGQLLADNELKEAIKKAKAKKANLAEFIIQDHIIDENSLYESAANYFKIPFVDLKNQVIRRDILSILPEPIVQKHKVIAFEKDEKSIKLAVIDPSDLQTFEFIEKKTGLKPELHLTSPSSIQEVLKQFHKGLKAEFQDITQEKGKLETAQSLKELAEDLPVIKMVDTLLEYAIFEGASDIHIEPMEKGMIVRYRIDGILRDVMSLPKSVKSGVLARIKILSMLKIDEHRLPQDGRFKIESNDQKVSFRVSILPVYDGEKAVLRLLRETAQVKTLEDLGFQPGPLEILKRNIKKPHGMILVTGPTGSGKTTTLYSVINVLNKPDVNISTVEDPIEYRMPRINQSQVNVRIGYSFANGLRSLLRQDPDIIMVGEIRDKDTAEIATHSAMTGHLVLSTLHTNDAVTTLPRLEEMGVPSFLIASTTNVVLAQRLVRKVCQNCIMSYTLTKKNIEELERQINFKNILKTLEHEGAIVSAEQSLDNLLFYRGKGCNQCNHDGYKGRVGIYEILEITPKISDLILNQAAAERLKEAAREQGMLEIIHDGFIKAKLGVTTIEEVLRVTQE